MVVLTKPTDASDKYLPSVITIVKFYVLSSVATKKYPLFIPKLDAGYRKRLSIIMKMNELQHEDMREIQRFF